MIYLELYWVFVKIGFASFGGMTMIPVIQDEIVLARNWLTSQQVMDIVAIAEMTPGSMGINMATFGGIQVAGFWGGITATLGVMTPSLTLCLLAIIFIEKMRGNKWLEAALRAVRPASIGMLIAVIFSMLSVFTKEFDWTVASVCWNRVAISAVLLFIYGKFKISVPKLILLAVVLGLCFGW